MEILEELKNAIINFEAEKAKKIAEEVIKKGIDPNLAIRKSVIEAANIVGEKFEKGEIFLAELIIVGDILKGVSNIFREAIKQKMENKASYLGRVVLATVEGDIHDIGKNLVGAFMEAEGFEVIDLGADVPTEKIIEKVKELKPDILGLSALLSTTMPKQQEVIKELEKAGLRDTVRVIVGGAPTTEEWARTIGADGWAHDAPGAAKKAKELLQLS